MSDYPTFPTDYYNAGGLFDSARYLDHNGDCWYGISFHPVNYMSMNNALEAARDDMNNIIAQDKFAKIIHERTKDQQQYRLWFIL